MPYSTDLLHWLTEVLQEGIKKRLKESNQQSTTVTLWEIIKTPYGLDALVGDVVTVLNNRKTRRESKTVMGAIHEIQNRLVGKDEKSKTQAMITHNPREVGTSFSHGRMSYP